MKLRAIEIDGLHFLLGGVAAVLFLAAIAASGRREGWVSWVPERPS